MSYYFIPLGLDVRIWARAMSKTHEFDWSLRRKKSLRAQEARGMRLNTCTRCPLRTYSSLESLQSQDWVKSVELWGSGWNWRDFGVSAGPVKIFHYYKSHKTEALLLQSIHRINFRRNEYLLGKQAFARVPTWNLLLITPLKGTL
jgi:hypothetical protein